MEESTGLVKAPRLCRIEKGANGYGFNLHGEKGVLGQYISAVDAGSPAEKSGLSIGDRVVEVNEKNVENSSHADVVKAIKEFPLHTTLLVIDRITDNYMKIKNLPITADFAKYSSVLDIPESSTPGADKTNENEVQEKANETNEDVREEKLQNEFSTVKIASDIEQVYDTPDNLCNKKIPESIQMTEFQADSVQQTEIHAKSVQRTEVHTDLVQITKNQHDLVQTAEIQVEIQANEIPVESIQTKEIQACLIQVSDQTTEIQPDLVKNSEDHDTKFKTNNEESGDKSPVHLDSEEKFEILPENAITQFTNALENASPSTLQKSSEIKKPLLSVIPQRKKVKETKDDWKAKQDLFNKL